ncbi:MAG: methylmalonyl-CoA mutase family protein [Thermodesulfobacteriota bacterium]|nr:methylmalonyl-CoA mutase family protein [Thermodesulfobacteriota bacterium]
MEGSKIETFRKTGSGIPVKEVYTPEDIKDFNYEKDLGLPGEGPYTRGIYSNMYRGKNWTIRQFSGFATPEETNKRYRYKYENGETGFSISVDSVSENGFDPDDPRAEDEVGQSGVSICSLEDMETLFNGLPIDKVSTAVITSQWTSPALAAMYFVMAEKQGVSLNKVNGTSQNDPYVFTLCCNLVDCVTPPYLLKLSVDLIEWCAQEVPNWHPVSFASYNYRENGVNAFQELGMLFSNAVGYIEEELSRNRLKIDDFAPVISFHLAAHNDFFEEIAKFRAARRMWYKLMKERYGAKDPRSMAFRFHVQTSGSTNIYQQILNNSVRIAYQVLAAGLGGAQSVHATSYDEPLCLPTDQSILLSLRTQQIAQYETNITNVADPLGGSYYVEWLTNEVEKKSWECFQEIEDRGGLVKVWESGWIHREAATAMDERQREIETGEKKIVGVNCFEMDTEPYEVPVFRPNPESTNIQADKVRQLRKKRDNTRVKKCLDKLRQVSLNNENVMPALMEAVRSYATLGEIQDIWRGIYPKWKIPIKY